MEAKICVEKGQVLVYRAFDIGGEIDLVAAQKLIVPPGQTGRFRLAGENRPFMMKEPPIAFTVGEDKVTLAGETRPAVVSGKVWGYGVLSLTFHIAIPPGTPWETMLKMAREIENSTQFTELALARKKAIAEQIKTAVKNPSDWDTFEDYTTWFIEKFSGVAMPEELLAAVDIPALLLAEPKERLSHNTKRFILETALQYSDGDLAVIDWNSALLVEPDGQRDTADVIEFSLTHLLEMRYYDELLERRLTDLYDALEGHRPGLLSNRYSQLAEDASRKYIEFSEFLSRLDNSLKSVGDTYLATVFRAAAREFRFRDWKASTARKMETLAKISEMVQVEINTRRSHWLEIVVIILIAIEIVPMFANMAH